MSITNLTNLSPWGVYIAGFIFFMGLSAGSLVLASLPVLFDLPRVRPFAKIACFIALAALATGALFIMIDLGHPERAWHMFVYGRLGSPMLWDLLLTIAYFIIGAALLVALIAPARANGFLKPLALLALLAGIADGLTAFVFATQIGREYWYSAVQPLAFFAGALASAGAVIILALLVLRPSGYARFAVGDLDPLPSMTAIAVGLGLLLIGSELVTNAFAGTPASSELVRIMLRSPWFWVEVVSGLVAVLLLLLQAPRRAPAALALGAALALTHLAVKRMMFVQMGTVVPNLSYAGVRIAPAVAYSPSPVEWAVGIGLVGLFAVILMLGFRILPLDTQS
jgi:dimethyl sulfoxide reductase membrane subunit